VEISDFFNYPTADDRAGALGREDDPFLGECSPGDWALIQQHADTVIIPQGGVVIEPGSTARALLIIIGGRVEVEIGGRRGHARVAVLGTGAVIGELGFFDGHRADALVRAREESTFMRLSLDSFEHLASVNAELALYILFDVGRILAGRLRRFEGPGTVL